jgi:hypothetical protein
MTRLFSVLLTLLFLSGPAMGENSDFRRCTLAAEGTMISSPGTNLRAIAAGVDTLNPAQA